MMDPNECLKRALVAMADGDSSEASFALAELNDWILNGGFLPSVGRAMQRDAWVIGRSDEA
jgi:hypothetical protein